MEEKKCLCGGTMRSLGRRKEQSSDWILRAKDGRHGGFGASFRKGVVRAVQHDLCKSI